jgi:hypothetical protein
MMISGCPGAALYSHRSTITNGPILLTGYRSSNKSPDVVDSHVVQHQSNVNSRNYNNLYNLMQANEPFSVLTAIEVSPDLDSTGITEVECDGNIVNCCFLPVHAAVILKANAIRTHSLWLLNCR